MAAVIFEGDSVKALKGAFKIGDGVTIHSGALNPSVDGFSAPVGDMYASNVTGQLYIKENNNPTDWGSVQTTNTVSDIVIDKFTLTVGDIANKYVLLSTAPSDKADTKLDVIGGTTQEYGADFEITNDNGGKRLSWNGLALDGLLASGDKLVVVYK